jgi:hypothetical protein
MQEVVLVVSGGHVLNGVAVVIEIVDHQAFLACVLVTPHLPQHFG